MENLLAGGFRSTILWMKYLTMLQVSCSSNYASAKCRMNFYFILLVYIIDINIRYVNKYIVCVYTECSWT